MWILANEFIIYRAGEFPTFSHFWSVKSYALLIFKSNMSTYECICM